MRFRDRIDAGRRLAQRLQPWRERNPIVLALPRGGVPVGAQVARALGCPLDVLVVCKLGAPLQPEFGIGAVAPDGVTWVDTELLAQLGLRAAAVDTITARGRQELERRLRRFRGERPMPVLRDRSVLLVDDGIATGVTMRAAVLWVLGRGPREVVVAVPVCATDSASALSATADEVLCLAPQRDLGAVGFWYDDFRQTTDEEVVSLLEEAWRRAAPAGGGEAPRERGDEAQGPGGRGAER